MISKQEHEKVTELMILSRSQTEVVHDKHTELDVLADICCKVFNVSISQFSSKLRTDEVALCRQVFFFMARNYCDTTYTLKSLGLFAGGRDHSTVCHSVTTVLNRLEYEDDLNDNCGDVLLEFKRLSK